MKIPDPILPEGVSIPLSVAFSGIKNLPLLSLANNSANPKLLIFEDATETKVLSSSRRPLSEIESIDVTKTLGTFHLTINWKNRWFDFTAAVEGDETLRSVVEFFRRKGVTLRDGAQRFIVEPKKD